MSKRKTCKDIVNVTSSGELEDGRQPSASPDGRTTDQHGPGAVPVSRSPAPERGWPSETNGTFGPLFEGSSQRSGQRLSLASKLMGSLPSNGSPEFTQTWKRLDIGFPKTKTAIPRLTLFRLAASGPRIKGQDCSGWPTATVNDSTGSQYAYSAGDHNKKVLKLPGAANLAGWQTCTTRDHKDGTEEACKNVPDNALLGRVALTAGPAPSGGLARMGSQEGCPPMNGARLNPRFSLYLMGFPEEWASCGERAMQSCRKSRRRS